MKSVSNQLERQRLSPVVLATAAAMWLGAIALDTSAAADVVEFDELEIFLEENATDGDLGIQLFLDGDGWDRINLSDPWGRKLVEIKVKGSAGVIGLTEIFSESAEPSFDEVSRAEFLALFPPGEYRFKGRTVDGCMLAGVATLTHTMPAPPVVVSPAEDDMVDASEPLVIEWETVPAPHHPDSVIVGYHVIVEEDDEDERSLTAEMLATDTTLTVAPGFLRPGKEYKVEVIAIESSGNKTITETPFETEGY